MNSISPNLNLMIKSCEKVSKVLIRDFGEVEKLQVSIKGPKNFVTNSDRKVEDMLVNELSKSKKKYSFLTEESGFIKNEDTENNQLKFNFSFHIIIRILLLFLCTLSCVLSLSYLEGGEGRESFPLQFPE